jgi:hypothetical protein
MKTARIPSSGRRGQSEIEARRWMLLLLLGGMVLVALSVLANSIATSW